MKKRKTKNKIFKCVNKQCTFIFFRNLRNNYNEIVIPEGMTGTLIFDDKKVHLNCDKIIVPYGTAWFTMSINDLHGCTIFENLV